MILTCETITALIYFGLIQEISTELSRLPVSIIEQEEKEKQKRAEEEELLRIETIKKELEEKRRAQAAEHRQFEAEQQVEVKNSKVILTYEMSRVFNFAFHAKPQ